MKKLIAFLCLARPHQYLKNGFVWLPVFFGYKIWNPEALIDTFHAFIAFCLAASSIYIVNDMKDIDDDRKHPVKRSRPLASGLVSRFEAMIIFSILLTTAGTISIIALPSGFLRIIGIYIAINIFYSFFLKHIAIVDVVCIAVGFVLRIFAGGAAANVYISPWIIIMTFLLALFLALAKRRDDLVLSEQGTSTRKSLDGYNLEFVSSSMVMMASVIIVSYILYTVSPEVVDKHGTGNLYLSAFWVISGLLRYMQITYVNQLSGSPTMVILKDYVLQAIVVLWLLNIYILLY